MDPRLFVIRMTAGRTEVAIVPKQPRRLLVMGPVERTAAEETYKAAAIKVIADALDSPDVRADLARDGMNLVVMR